MASNALSASEGAHAHSGGPDERRQPFSDLPARAIIALLLPFLAATAVSQAITLLLLPGPDGFYLSVSLLWSLLWAAAFFHAVFDRLSRVLWIHASLTALACVPLAQAIMTFTESTST